MHPSASMRIRAARRDQSGDFCMAVDHCFAIRGQGTVMTGTVLSGRVAVGDEVEEPSRRGLRETKHDEEARTIEHRRGIFERQVLLLALRAERSASRSRACRCSASRCSKLARATGDASTGCCSVRTGKARLARSHWHL